MNEKKNHGNDKTDLVKHIFDCNQNIIQMADTKVGILLATNAIIISLSAARGLRTYSMYSGICMISAIVLSAFSSFMLLLAMFPRVSENRHDTVIFYKGILKYSQKEYASKMTKIRDDELLKDYSNSIYDLALIQKKKYRYLILGLTSLVFAIILIALSLVFQSVGGS